MQCLMDIGLPVFQSALPLRGATAAWQGRENNPEISIRAPLAGSDKRVQVRLVTSA